MFMLTTILTDSSTEFNHFDYSILLLTRNRIAIIQLF
jgi:hypothetical protein